MAARYAVLIDKPIPGLIYGPEELLGHNDRATMIREDDDLETAKKVAETLHKEHLRLVIPLGRVRIYDRSAKAVVLTLAP